MATVFQMVPVYLFPLHQAKLEAIGSLPSVEEGSLQLKWLFHWRNPKELYNSRSFPQAQGILLPSCSLIEGRAISIGEKLLRKDMWQ